MRKGALSVLNTVNPVQLLWPERLPQCAIVRVNLSLLHRSSINQTGKLASDSEVRRPWVTRSPTRSC
jgi:hypothetical protein